MPVLTLQGAMALNSKLTDLDWILASCLVGFLLFFGFFFKISVVKQAVQGCGCLMPRDAQDWTRF